MIYSTWRDILTRWEMDIFFRLLSTDVNVFFAINETFCSLLTGVLPHCWGNPFPRLLALSPPWSSLSPTVTDDCCVTASFTRLSPDIPIGCSFFFRRVCWDLFWYVLDNLLKSIHHHYKVRSAVVCREWERGSENWRLNGLRSAAGSDSTRLKKFSCRRRNC